MRTLLMDSTSTPPQQQQRSTWHSPIPYVFGGLAAMLGLIAFALLVLACSHWRVSRGEEEDESVPKESSLDVEKPVRVLEQKVVVILAGEIWPTHIATPVHAKNVCCIDTDNIGKNAGQGGGCTSDEEEKKDGPHCHVIIESEREEEDQRSR